MEAQNLVHVTCHRYDKSSFYELPGGAKVSANCLLPGHDRIHAGSKTIIDHNSIVRGDLAHVNIGKQCFIGKQVVLRSPISPHAQMAPVAAIPMTIGDYVYIGEDSVVEAATVGSNVWIGARAVIGKRCVLKDCCVVHDDAVLPPDMVVPPFAVVAGCPASVVGQIENVDISVHQDRMVTIYTNFQQKKQ